jgi:hypothetical protein
MEAAPGTIARRRELLLVSAAGLALTILFTWPLATDLCHLGRTLATDADGQFGIWNVAWVARTIVADPLGLYDANIFHPHKLTLAYSEANILTGAIGIPVYWLSRNPWLTINVVMFVGFVSSYAGAYLLFSSITGDRRAAAATAILYAFCPYVLSHFSHIQLLMTGGIPLALFALHRLADDAFRLKAETTQTAVASGFSRKVIGRGIWLGLALVAQALTCAYYGIFAGLSVGFAALVLATTRALWTSRAYWIALAAGAATSIAIVLPFFIPFLLVQQESGFARSLQDTAQWAAKPHGYLVSSSNAHRWLLEAVRSLGPWNEVLFPGLLAVVLGLAGAASAARGSRRDREAALIYGSLGVLAFWASFGPQAGLYRILYYLPTFSFLRAPSRLGLVVVLCLALLATFAIRALLAAVTERRRSLVTGIVIVAAVADLAVVPLIWYRAPTLPPAYALLAGSPRAVLAEFPFYGSRIAFPLHAQYMLFSTAHWMPMVNGYSDVIPMDFREAAPALDSFPSPEAFAALARRRVRYIGVHWDMYAGRHEEIRARLERYRPHLRTLAADERMTLYEVVRYP